MACLQNFCKTAVVGGIGGILDADGSVRGYGCETLLNCNKIIFRSVKMPDFGQLQQQLKKAQPQCMDHAPPKVKLTASEPGVKYLKWQQEFFNKNKIT